MSAHGSPDRIEVWMSEAEYNVTADGWGTARTKAERALGLKVRVESDYAALYVQDGDPRYVNSTHMTPDGRYLFEFVKVTR